MPCPRTTCRLRSREWLMIALAFTGLMLLLGQAARQPDVVRLSIAGVSVVDAASRTKPDVNLYDPMSGYYLYHSGDCDGASIDLVFSREGSYPGPQAAPLLAWRARLDVPLGQTPEKVIRALGAPPVSERDDPYQHLRVLRYEAKVDIDTDSGDYPNYSAEYTFRNNRLVEVRYSLGSSGGCG